MGCFAVLGQINYLAVIVCTIIAAGLGALWYSPALFGNTWMNGIGLKKEDIDPKSATTGMIVSMITTLIEMIVLASIIIMTSTEKIGMGIHVGALLSIGCISTSLLSNSLYEQKPMNVWMINAGYRVLYFLINGAILVAWS